MRLYHSLQARVAADQLSLLASARTVRVYLQSEQVPPARYRRWSGSLQDCGQNAGVMATAERQ